MRTRHAKGSGGIAACTLIHIRETEANVPFGLSVLQLLIACLDIIAIEQQGAYVGRSEATAALTRSRPVLPCFVFYGTPDIGLSTSVPVALYFICLGLRL